MKSKGSFQYQDQSDPVKGKGGGKKGTQAMRGEKAAKKGGKK